MENGKEPSVNIRKMLAEKGEPYISGNKPIERRSFFNATSVSGLPFGMSSKSISFRQNMSSKNKSAEIRNVKNINSLDNGFYMYVIEYSKSRNRYFTHVFKVKTCAEIGTKHFMLPTHNNTDRIILMAGEFSKSSPRHTVEPVVTWNTSSGTFMSGSKISTKYNISIFESIFRDALGIAGHILIFRESIPCRPPQITPKQFMEAYNAGIIKGPQVTRRDPFTGTNDPNEEGLRQLMINIEKLRETPESKRFKKNNS